MAAALYFVTDTLRMLSGVLIWGAHFGVVYIATALVCARGGSEFKLARGGHRCMDGHHCYGDGDRGDSDHTCPRLAESSPAPPAVRDTRFHRLDDRLLRGAGTAGDRMGNVSGNAGADMLALISSTRSSAIHWRAWQPRSGRPNTRGTGPLPALCESFWNENA